MRKKRVLHHIIDDDDPPYDRATRTFCDKPLRPRATAKNPYPLQLKWLSVSAATTNVRLISVQKRSGIRPGIKICAPCQRFVAMTPEQRAEVRSELETRKRVALNKLKLTVDLRREVALQELDTKIARGRADAIVMLDAWKVGRRSQTDDLVQLDDTLALAVMAHRRANPRSRGERLCLLKMIYTCADCGCSSTSYAMGREGPSGPLKICSECASDTLYEDKGEKGQTRAVCCRFCELWMGCGNIGTDHSEKIFYNADEPRDRWRRPETHDWKSIDVREHTVTCALRYLAGLEVPEPTQPQNEDELIKLGEEAS